VSLIPTVAFFVDQPCIGVGNNVRSFFHVSAFYRDLRIFLDLVVDCASIFEQLQKDVRRPYAVPDSLTKYSLESDFECAIKHDQGDPILLFKSLLRNEVSRDDSFVEALGPWFSIRDLAILLRNHFAVSWAWTSEAAGGMISLPWGKSVICTSLMVPVFVLEDFIRPVPHPDTRQRRRSL